MKRTLIAATAAAGTLLLTACASSSSGSHATHPMSARPGMGGSSMSGSGMSSQSPTMHATSPAPSPRNTPAAGPHNSQDVNFATNMIPHHRQAITMADMALTQATDPTVKTLAASIKAAQAPEIATMTGWLTGWGKPTPGPSMSMSMGHGGMSMPGMMSDADMTSLHNATGSAFDKLWLKQMIIHHRGAVTMAKTELASGQNAAAKALARSIVTSQSKQISAMTRLIATIK